MPIHTFVAICKRGHVASYDAGPDPVEAYCQECGAALIKHCPTCDDPIVGPEAVGDGWGNLDVQFWSPPKFCWKCGKAFPWADRQSRIHELENLLDAEQLDPADDLAVREQLRALADTDPDDDEAKRRWAEVREKAPGLWEKSGARSILESVVSASIKAGLGL